MAHPPAVLFVCLGNICRSPTAEAVFRQKARAAGVDVEVDSAGTHGYHIGKAPDKRSQAAGQARGYNFDGVRCRRVDKSDFVRFDYVLAMDHSNLSDLKGMSDPQFHSKIQLLLDFADTDFEEVPDPYYGGRQGFELVLDLIEQASEGLLDRLKSNG
ncbi:low molecular weight phosphotyrosine protein phosphatase [Alteromonas aestuariivivens]|uniref:protein-tyrosine-phosphatase n=1 Tax=Alteromonas aestuariivivens TaxID=1938339 RepID=A0A3D8M3E2_9ALTE|nr:low molecular weight protein-tyrosine-phosphatase [Alteromonas aestuariivivens]RDV24257.1 low molecular weight phosphotyrosine protein phosphatase [Alteromonas aestuariivivens]